MREERADEEEREARVKEAEDREGWNPRGKSEPNESIML